MTNHAILSALTFALALCSGCGPNTKEVAEAPAVASAERLSAAIDDFFRPLAASRDFSGIVRVDRGGELVVERRFAFANLETGEATGPDTLYSAASVTKGVLAATLVSLVGDGVVSLDDPVHTYLPDFPNGPGLTIAQVLHHRAGLPRDLPADLDPRALEGGVARWLAAEPGRMSEPGEESYSNVGYALLAQLVEAATGESFASLAQTRVLAPAGMASSHISDGLASEEAGGAVPYMPGPAPDGLMAPVPANLEIGSSGLITTVEDLSRWVRYLGQGHFPELFEPDDPLGSIDRGEDDGRRYIAVQGSLPGYAAGATYWPDEDVAISYTANIFSYPVVGIEPILRDIGWGGSPRPPVRPADAALSEAQLSMEGRYAHPAFGEVLIRFDQERGGMFLMAPERGAFWDFYLTPVADGRLYWRAFATQIERDGDEDLKFIQMPVSGDTETVSVQRAGTDADR